MNYTKTIHNYLAEELPKKRMGPVVELYQEEKRKARSEARLYFWLPLALGYGAGGDGWPGVIGAGVGAVFGIAFFVSRYNQVDGQTNALLDIYAQTQKALHNRYEDINERLVQEGSLEEVMRNVYEHQGVGTAVRPHPFRIYEWHANFADDALPSMDVREAFPLHDRHKHSYLFSDQDNSFRDIPPALVRDYSTMLTEKPLNPPA